MALNKNTLQQAIYDGFYRIFTNQAAKATSGDESEDPDTVIKNIATEMATVVSDAVETFVKSGDVSVGPANIQVTSASPGSPASVAPLQPAKMT